MKTMKVSNQSCSTMRKQVFRMFHHTLPLSLVMSTERQGNLFTQPGDGAKTRALPPGQGLPTSPTPFVLLLPFQTLPGGGWSRISWF